MFRHRHGSGGIVTRMKDSETRNEIHELASAHASHKPRRNTQQTLRERKKRTGYLSINTIPSHALTRAINP